MRTIHSQLEEIVQSAIAETFGVESAAAVGVSQNEKFGDYQSNAAMGLAKTVSQKTGTAQNPRGVAEKLKAALGPKLTGMVLEISIAGPGFVNFRLSPQWLAGQLEGIAKDKRVGVDTTANPQIIVMDYSGPNIAKEMHVGHLRSTIIGDAISRVLEFQTHKIVRQNHVGDWGTQFGRVVLAIWYRVMAEHFNENETLERLMNSMREAKEDTAKVDVVRATADLHRRIFAEDEDGTRVFEPALEKLSLNLTELETLYQFVSSVTDHPRAKDEMIGKHSLADLPRLFTTFIQDPSDPRNKQEKMAWQKASEATLESCNEIYAELGVKLRPEDVRGESAYQDDLPTVVSELKASGVAEDSEGAVVVPIPGFESPLMIEKSDGGYLYGTTDLAAIRYRIKHFHANRIVYTHDSRQQEHFKKVFWTAKKVGWAEKVELDYTPFGTILGENGKPFRTRGGGTVHLKDLLDEAKERALKVVTEKQPDLAEDQRQSIAHAVGIGAVKYGDLSKDRVSDYQFSFDKMLALDGNTAPYLQYAHARVRSIFRKAGDAKPGAIKLESPFELALAKHILRLGEVIELVARELKPHHLCAYLYELATRFSGFFENCPVIQSEPAMRASRLSLCDLTARTMELGLDLLGIEHPDKM